MITTTQLALGKRVKHKQLTDVEKCPLCGSYPYMEYYYVNTDLDHLKGRRIYCECGHISSYAEKPYTEKELTKLAKQEWNNEVKIVKNTKEKAQFVCDICGDKMFTWNCVGEVKYCPKCYMEYKNG